MTDPNQPTKSRMNWVLGMSHRPWARPIGGTLGSADVPASLRLGHGLTLPDPPRARPFQVSDTPLLFRSGTQVGECGDPATKQPQLSVRNNKHPANHERKEGRLSQIETKPLNVWINMFSRKEAAGLNVLSLTHREIFMHLLFLHLSICCKTH